MSEENNLENFFNNILNVMQMEVKHIFYGNIAKEDARKNVDCRKKKVKPASIQSMF